MDLKIVIATFACFAFIALSDAGKFFDLDDHRYYLSNPLRKNWFEADRFCIYHGMVLADILDDDEHARIQSIIQDPEYENSTDAQYWTSGTDLGSEGNFYWSSSSHSILFSDFETGQPDNYLDNENCVEIRRDYNWKWNDALCLAKNYFICRNTVSFPNTNPNCNSTLELDVKSNDL